MSVVRSILLVLCGLLSVVYTNAQLPDSTRSTLKIAVFAPVYLDSAFTEDFYKLGKGSIPRYMLPGLDFYNGVMLAVDSLNKEKVPIEVLFYDTKNTATSIEELLRTDEMKNISLIISSFTTRTEVKPLADFALANSIPLISATYPNDAGITANPFFVILNPTLISHIEAIYKYIRRSFPTDNITMFRRQGDVGDLIQSVFGDMNNNTPGTLLKIKTVELRDNFTSAEVLVQLDSNRQRNIVFCAAINEAFGSNLSKVLSSNKSYHATVIGMPTWDGLKDISTNLDIIYSTPYNLQRTDKLSTRITDLYKKKYAGRASDMVFKGYESMYRFTKLLLKYGDTLINHLSDKEYKLFHDFDIQPVKTGKESTQINYLENKKLYFIRKKNGMVKSIN
ncbi:MAG: hypothetical protein ABIS69_11355 [Sediminibacterium sp.]